MANEDRPPARQKNRADQAVPDFEASDMMSEMRYLRLCAAFCIASLAIQGCQRLKRESAWNGTWKLSMSKSQAYGRYVTIAIAPDEVVTLTNETISVNFRCNNQEFQNGSARTSACMALNASQWKLTNRINGKVTGAAIWDVSSDGRTLTIRNGTSGASEFIYVRRDGANGFAGRWQQTAPLRSVVKTLVIAQNGQYLHLASPETGQYSDSPLDGAAVPIHGPLVWLGVTGSVRAISPRQFDTQTMYSGKVIRKGTMELSGDGRTLLTESWRPDDPDEKDRLVYDRQ